MGKPRRLWVTGEGDKRDVFPSQKQAYQFTQALASSYATGGDVDPQVNVWVDERDGNGWQLYERISLADLVAADSTDGA